MSDRVQLGSLVKLSTESAKDPAAVGLTRSVGLDHIDSDDLRLRRWSDIGNGADFTRVFRAGDVLFGKRRSYQRKVALADFDGVCSGDILVVRTADPRLDGLYLAYLLASPLFIGHAISSSAGSLSPRIRPRDLERFEFDLPSLDEQHRVVEVMRAVDREIEAAEQVHLCATTALSSFADRVWTQAKTYVPLGHYAADKTGQLFDGDWLETKDQSDSGIRIVQLADIGIGVFLDKSARFITEGTAVRLGCNLLKGGDLLISRMADPIGRTCVLPDRLTGSVTAVDVAVLRVADQSVSDYLSCVLQAPSWFRECNKLASGTTRSRISRSRLEAIKVPLKEDDAVAVHFDRLRTLQSASQTLLDTAMGQRASLLKELIG
jgi:type I restriction enzyme S subunit